MKDSFDGADHYSIRGYLEHVRKTSSDATCDNRALAKDASEKKLETAGTKPVAAKSVGVKSDAAQSCVAQPAGSESGAAKSASAQSVGSKHDAARPVGTKPFVVRVVGVGSDVARRDTAQPVSAKPAAAGQTDEGAAEVELPW